MNRTLANKSSSVFLETVLKGVSLATEMQFQKQTELSSENILLITTFRNNLEQFDDLAIITPSVQQINLTHRVYISLVCGSAGPCLELTAFQWHKSEKSISKCCHGKRKLKEIRGSNITGQQLCSAFGNQPRDLSLGRQVYSNESCYRKSHALNTHLNISFQQRCFLEPDLKVLAAHQSNVCSDIYITI